MTAGTRPVTRNFLTPLRLARERGNAFNDNDFMVQPSTSAAQFVQLVRPPLNSKSEVTEELLCIRLIASPNNFATDSVVILTALIGERRTGQDANNPTMLDYLNRRITI